jgi:hypothetical protein
MRLRAMLVTAILSGSVSAAGPTTRERPVPVCMPLGSDIQPLRVAQKLADHMFAEVDLKLEWRKKGLCTEEDIVITLSYKTPDDQAPGGWAYALPYEGTHIVVFWDRIQQKMPPARAPILLAHVLAHEIAHILQGTVRHSESGLMKAVWTSTDFFEMGRKPLPFTEVDVLLIHRGLEARRAGLSSNDRSLATSAR